MRKIAALLLIIVLGCKENKTPNGHQSENKAGIASDEEKMDSAISHYMKTHINDYASYQSIRFSRSKVDSTLLSEDSTYMKLMDEERAVRAKDAYITETTPVSDYSTYKYLLAKKAVAESLLKIEKNKIIYSQGFAPKPCGFGVMHIFRRKNKSGGVVLDSMYFRFDYALNLRDEDYYSLINKD